MAGHSKWKNIRARKSAQDKVRGKMFTKLIREITTAARMGGGDPGANPRLRTAIDKALSFNMTRDTIERATKKGAGGLEGADMEQIRYEGYGPGGVAVLVDCLTDNRNRTVADVRHAFTKCGGNLGMDGSVGYLFSKQGIVSFVSTADEDKIMEVALEAGAEDVVSDEEGVEVKTSADQFENVRSAMQAAGLHPSQAEVSMVASTQVSLDKENAEKMIRLLDMLEDLVDVQDVYSNADISEEYLL